MLGMNYSINKTVNDQKRKEIGISVLAMCKIIKVHESNLSADVYLPRDSKTLLEVPICFPSRGVSQGAIFMPQESSTAILMATPEGKTFVYCSASFSEQINESVLKGENYIYSAGKSFLKQDISGAQILSSGNLNLITISGRESTKMYSQNFQNKTLGKKLLQSNANGFSYEIQEYYQNIDNQITYKMSEIIDAATMSINDTIRTNIITAADNIISKINLFITDVTNFRENIMSNSEIDENTLYEKVSLMKTKLYNDYSIAKMPNLIIEHGTATNSSVKSVGDINALTNADYAKSQEGNNIVYRITVKDNAGNTNATLLIDSDGFMTTQCKGYRVEVQ